MRAVLPTEEEISSLIKNIDINSKYTNFGPLSLQLTSLISKSYGLPNDCTLVTASGTVGLQALILYYITKSKDLPLHIVTPAWTFPATVQAALASGQRVTLLDTNKQGYLSSSVVKNAIDSGLRVDLVITVVPFGCRTDLREWDKFTEKTGIPVIIDAAAGFFSIIPVKTPVVVSLHATKGFSSGEGGFIVSTDEKLVRQIRPCINFGYEFKREASTLGINGKMSEYNAAVGIADFQSIEITKAKLLRSYDYYTHLIDSSSILTNIQIFSDRSARTTFNIKLNASISEAKIAKVMSDMISTYGIEVRSWWGLPIFNQPIGKLCYKFHNYDNSLYLSSHVIGLPFGMHMTEMIQESVVRALEACV